MVISKSAIKRPEILTSAVILPFFIHAECIPSAWTEDIFFLPHCAYRTEFATVTPAWWNLHRHGQMWQRSGSPPVCHHRININKCALPVRRGTNQIVGQVSLVRLFRNVMHFFRQVDWPTFGNLWSTGPMPLMILIRVMVNGIPPRVDIVSSHPHGNTHAPQEHQQYFPSAFAIFFRRPTPV